MKLKKDDFTQYCPFKHHRSKDCGLQQVAQARLEYPPTPPVSSASLLVSKHGVSGLAGLITEQHQTVEAKQSDAAGRHGTGHRAIEKQHTDRRQEELIVGLTTSCKHQCVCVITFRSLLSRCSSSEPRMSCCMKVSLYSPRLSCSSQTPTSSVPHLSTTHTHTHKAEQSGAQSASQVPLHLNL